MKIDNFYLRNIINNYLGLDKEMLNQDDLNKITSLKIDNAIDIFELSSFSCLNELIIYDKYISLLDLKILNNFNKLKTIYFINCNIDSFDSFNNKQIESLFFENCNVDSFLSINNLNNLKTLHLDNMQEIDLNFLSIIRKLNNLSFHNTSVLNEEKLIYLDNIINLDLYNTNIDDFNIILTLDTLKVLVINQKMALRNKELVLKLINKNVSVINEMNKSVVMYYE